MATLTPTLTLASTDGITNETLGLSATDALTVTAPSAGLSTIAVTTTGANNIIQAALDGQTRYVYVKHTGLLASNGTSSSHASNDFITLSSADGDTDFIKLQPEEFAFFPLNPFDGSDGGTEPGGLKVEAGSAAVIVEFGYWKRS